MPRLRISTENEKGLWFVGELGCVVVRMNAIMQMTQPSVWRRLVKNRIVLILLSAGLVT